MRIEFTKMNGAGNDFILIDNRNRNVTLSQNQISKLCDRHRGVGADGIMLLVESNDSRAEWAWEFYNSDGSAANMCGNGARCFARFVQSLTGVENSVRFVTGAGVIHARFLLDRVEVELTPPTNILLGKSVQSRLGELIVHFVNTGVPHAVVFVDGIRDYPVHEIGSFLRFHPEFQPAGTNVNFVSLVESCRISVRTYERGVEAETLACGTGVTAAAVVSSLIHGLESPVLVGVKSGDTLHVSFQKNSSDFSAVQLGGPADFAFTGTVEV